MSGNTHHVTHNYDWNTSDDNNVYESPTDAMTERLTDRPDLYPKGHVTFNNDYDYDYEERVIEAPIKARQS